MSTFFVESLLKFLFDHDQIRSKQDRDLSKSIKHFTMEEFRAFRDLILLLEENETVDPPTHNTITNSPSPAVKPRPATKFKPKSRKFPDLTTNPQIWAFMTATTGELRHLTVDPMPKNVSSDQLQSISKLRNHPDLVIKQVDKGGNVVLMTHDQYVGMCMDILSNHSWYRRISASSTQGFIIKYKSIIGNAYHVGLIGQDTHAYLDTKFPRTPTFYSLPKTHKSLHAPPGHPIVSGIGSLTENASRLIYFFLTPHVI